MGLIWQNNTGITVQLQKYIISIDKPKTIVSLITSAAAVIFIAAF